METEKDYQASDSDIILVMENMALQLRRDMDRLFHPFGREASVDRLNRLAAADENGPFPPEVQP